MSSKPTVTSPKEVITEPIVVNPKKGVVSEEQVVVRKDTTSPTKFARVLNLTRDTAMPSKNYARGPILVNTTIFS